MFTLTTEVINFYCCYLCYIYTKGNHITPVSEIMKKKYIKAQEMCNKLPYHDRGEEMMFLIWCMELDLPFDTDRSSPAYQQWRDGKEYDYVKYRYKRQVTGVDMFSWAEQKFREDHGIKNI